MDTIQAIDAFRQLCSSVQDSSAFDFMTWVKENIDGVIADLQEQKKDNSDVILESIRDELRSLMPVEGTSNTETIVTPAVGLNKDCNPETTAHVDAFCYDDDDIDELCDEGLMSRNYCADCKSRNIKPLTFITHSASVKQIKFMFKYLLPDLRGKVVVDVGSRTGAVLYGAYLYSNAQSIIGVEMDPSFCQLQQKIVSDYKLADRIQVIQDDIMNCQSIFSSADVVVLNNVFEFFMDIEQQKRIWEYLYAKIRKSGCVLLTVPSVEESLGSLNCCLDVTSWLKPVDTKSAVDRGNVVLYGTTDSEDSDLHSIFVYEIV